LTPGIRRSRARLLLRPLAAVALAASLAACSAAATGGSPSASAPAPTPAPPVTAPPTAAPTVQPTPDALPSPASGFPVTLTDDDDATVMLGARPARIVSLTPAVTETLFALGAGDRLVANSDFDDFPAQVGGLPHVASYTGVDVEKVVGLEPDLVIAGGNGFNPPEEIAKLRSLGIPVVVVYADSVEGILRDIELVGTAVGAADAATTLTAWMRDRIAMISAAAAGAGSSATPRVFYELDATNEIYGPAPDSFLAAMIALAGGDPVTTGDPAVFAIPLETLVAADPEVIVLGDAAYGTTPDAVAQRPGWSAMTAVKAGAVRPVDDTIVTRPGPRIVDGLRALALAIDPTLQLPEVGSPPPLPAP
jgi:iron complex transport system substrate-binding protein